MARTPKKTIWIVEDEPEICCLFADLLTRFEMYYVVCVEDARQVQANPGDVIFLDLHGTKARHLNANGARVITMSGDEAAGPTLQKPFSFPQIQVLLRSGEGLSKAA